MPYIKSYDRQRLYQLANAIDAEQIHSAGELNYLITLMVIKYLKIHGLSYQSCNDIVGALDNAKDEFKRRVQDRYEDKKIIENKDVYPDEYLG